MTTAKYATGEDIRKALPDGAITEISKTTEWSMPVVKKVIDSYPECRGDMRQMNEIIGCAIKIIKREKEEAKHQKNQIAALLNQSSADTHLSE